jgi:hypothetical protein
VLAGLHDLAARREPKQASKQASKQVHYPYAEDLPTSPTTTSSQPPTASPRARGTTAPNARSRPHSQTLNRVLQRPAPHRPRPVPYTAPIPHKSPRNHLAHDARREPSEPMHAQRSLPVTVTHVTVRARGHAAQVTFWTFASPGTGVRLRRCGQGTCVA